MIAEDLQCPQLVRPSLKRSASLDGIDPEHPPTKRRQLLPTPSVSPPGTLKRAFGSDDSDLPSKKCCLVQSPLLASSVRNWLSRVPSPDVIARPNTAPPSLSTALPTPAFEAPAFELPTFPLPTLEPEADMSQLGRTRPASVASTANTRPSTSDPLYREAIHWCGITLDPTGMAIAEEKETQTLLDKYILKERSGSPPLESKRYHRHRSIPLERRAITEGRQSQWSTDALPTSPKNTHQLATPKPDHHYGYPLGRKFNWTEEEMAVINHRTAQPYTQPTRDNILPFLALEVKSEATRGVLYVAENQAVGSGAHIVASQRWMLRQAFPSKDPVATDAVAFVGAISQRTSVFYVVWYSDKKDRYVMSKIKTISFMETSDIQPCRNLVNNIIDYGSKERLPLIKEALAKLDPVPSHWKKSRLPSVIAETPSASYSEEETRSNKSRKI
ncbi:hypothetical protein GGR55DRAFT_681807 [Xylaria sp. FL0064]|nr:hypothetical protein GGR55DRAFT_681807 [Xylaria sp. FL0064]